MNTTTGLPAPEPHPTSLELELLALGGLQAEVSARLDAHLRACDACRASHARFEDARVAFNAHVFPRTLPVVTGRVLGRQRFFRWRSLRLTVPALAAAAAALVVGIGLRGPSTLVGAGDAREGIRAKGGATLSVVARSGAESFAVGPSHPALAAGTEIRFVVNGGGLPFVMIASVDGAGRATIYYPFDGTSSARLAGDGRRELPGSIILDDTSGSERIFALCSREPLATAAVLAALRRFGRPEPETGGAAAPALDVPADEQASVVIEKLPARPSR